MTVLIIRQLLRQHISLLNVYSNPLQTGIKADLSLRSETARLEPLNALLGRGLSLTRNSREKAPGAPGWRHRPCRRLRLSSAAAAGSGSAEPPRHPALSEGRAGTYLSHSEAVVKSVISNTSDSGYGERGGEVVSGESRGRERDSQGTGKQRKERDKHSLRCPPPSCAAAGPPQRRRLPGTW